MSKTLVAYFSESCKYLSFYTYLGEMVQAQECSKIRTFRDL